MMNHEQYMQAKKFFRDILNNSEYTRKGYTLSSASTPYQIRDTIESNVIAQTLIDLQSVIEDYEITKRKEAKKARIEKSHRIAASARTFLSELKKN